MKYLQKAALVEYTGDLLGGFPNIVIFQFNPETLSRSINIPPRSTGASSREENQAGEIPIEKITFTAHFSAADKLSVGDTLVQQFGVNAQLAALEQMVHPSGEIASLIHDTVDKVGALIGMKDKESTQPVPRKKYPRILFIWNRTRILPVTIESMTINEQKYDQQLNPVQAEVSIGLSVMTIDPCSDDELAKGALEYSKLMKESQAISNLGNTSEEIINQIPF